MRLVYTVAALCLYATTTSAHDPYREFWSGGAPGIGIWCCSGNLEGTTGDCSPATYQMNSDGSAFFSPKQYPGATILVPGNRILWMSLPDPEARKFEGHWCGRPRPEGVLPTADDPDPAYITICAAIAPGGV